MVKREIDPETANEIAKELAELRAQLESQKKAKRKSTTQTRKKRASKQSTSTKKIKSLNDETVLNTNPDNNKKTKESSSTEVPHLFHHYRADVTRYEMETEGDKFPNLIPEVEKSLRKYVQEKYETENNLLKIIKEKSNENNTYAKKILKNFDKRKKSGLTDNTNLTDAMDFGDLINYTGFYDTNKTLWIILDLIRTFRNFMIGHPGEEPYFNIEDSKEGFAKFLFYACALADSLVNDPEGSWVATIMSKTRWEMMPIELKNVYLSGSKKTFLAAPSKIQELWRKEFENPEYDQIE